MYIDIHVHKYYQQDNTVLLQNLFPQDADTIDKNGFFSIGLHPWHVNTKKYTSDISIVKAASENSRVIAIGEIGLDKKIDISYIDQLHVFEQQLDIAENLNKPVIIHCVKAYDDILSIRKKSNRSIPWIFHWFNASQQIAEEILKYNGYLSFGIMLFKENSKAFKVFQQMPLNKLFLETDDAGVTILEAYDKAAKTRNISIGALSDQILDNFKTCFGNIL